MKMVGVLGVFFVVCSHPFFMVLSLGFLSVFVAFLVYSEVGSFWLGYLLLFVVVSGLLVIFTYMASMVPSDRFFFDSGIFWFFLLIGLVFVVWEFGVMCDFVCMKMWDSFMFFYNVLMLSILLSVMIFVVWMSGFFEGAVRVMCES